jgi:hypothetical protein
LCVCGFDVFVIFENDVDLATPMQNNAQRIYQDSLSELEATFRLKEQAMKRQFAQQGLLHRVLRRLCVKIIQHCLTLSKKLQKTI